MIKNYAMFYINVLLCGFLIFMSSPTMMNKTYGSIKKSFEKAPHVNVFALLEKPVLFLVSLKDSVAPVRQKFCEWHENVFYFPVNEHQKKMFLSARIVTALIPLAIIGVVMYTSPQLVAYIWNINYNAITTSPSTITPALVAREVGKLSSFNQNCLMIGLEKGLHWLMGRKLAPDVCINPATWFTDKTNHDFINNLTSILLIIIIWIYMLYCMYTDPTIHRKNIIRIMLFQIVIRYALFLASLKNDINNISLMEQLNYTTKSPEEKISLVQYAMQKDLKNSIDDIAITLKKLVTVTEQHTEQEEDEI